jgi:hypothetical protein
MQKAYGALDAQKVQQIELHGERQPRLRIAMMAQMPADRP